MKIFTSQYQNKITRTAAIIMLSAVSLLFNACSKDEAEVAAISGLMVVNASPSAGTFNFYAGTSKINSAALPFLGTVPYFQIAPGATTVKFTNASSIESLLTKTITLEAEKPYSFFLINDVPQLDGILIKDDLSPTSTDKAFIRFINLSPNAPALDLVQTGGSVLISDKSFKAVSDFVLADAKSYSFDLKDKVTGEIVATLKDITLIAGKMYTIAACGLIKPADLQQPVRLEVFINR
jgi:hypothetical protein